VWSVYKKQKQTKTNKAMILGFKQQFKDKILDNSKIHSIRQDKKERWKSGRLIQFCTGVRTKQHYQFYEDVVKSVQTIEIFTNIKSVIIDSRVLTDEQVYDLAINDGFDSIHEFYEWFKQYENEYHFFTGRLIHWTNHKY
jgi:hypothetical protein